jgi:anti-sigma B factor antagonist
MAEAAAAAGSYLVLDLARVQFIPSLSLAALIRMLTECRARDQQLMLVGLHPHIREMFRLTRLDRLFELQPDVPSALRKIRPL